MMTDTAVQQQADTNGQALVTQSERQALVQKLAAKWTLELSTRIENIAYEKSRGIKPIYFKFIQSYHQQVQDAYQNRANQQQQQQQQQNLQSLNNNGIFPNQQLNLSQSTSIPMLNQPQHQLNQMLNQQPRFPSVPQQLQTRMINPQQSILNTQSGVHNQLTRLREPQQFNQQSLNTISYASSPLNSLSTPPPTVQTIDLSQNYSPQQQINNINPNDYLSHTATLQNRYSNQQPMNPRTRVTTNLNGNFPLQSASNNSNDVLHQYVVGNPSANSMMTSSVAMNTNTSTTGDRLLQQILLSNNDGSSNKTGMPNRQSNASIMPQPIRTTNTANSNMSNSTNPLRTSMPQQPSPSSSVMIMQTPSQSSTVQLQSSNNVTIQQSPLNNNNNGPFSINTQSLPQPPSMIMNSSTPLNNNHSSPITRALASAASGSISSPDDETINLLKYLKENIGKLQLLCQKIAIEGNVDKARNAQAIHQQMVQFITNPTYEGLVNAKHVRDMLERATNRSQQQTTTTSTKPVAAIPNPPNPQANDWDQFEKAVSDFLSRDQKKRIILSKLFVEPLSDVLNGVPHKKIRLDVDNCSNTIGTRKIRSSNQSSLLSRLNDEINCLPADVFSIERIPVSNFDVDDEYLNKNGIVLRCTLLETSNPRIAPLRLRISTRYPEEQPEVLSLTKSMPPKLEFTDGHPFFEQISTLFVSYLFKLHRQHTITDILNIWRQSVQTAL